MAKIATLKDLSIWATETAANQRQEDVDFLLAERLGLSPSEFELKQEMALTDAQIKQAQKDVKKLAKGISPQYILGYSWFYGYKILVEQGVLIPRFETEELVAWTLEELKSGETVLDLGTGSGCITVALAKEAAKKGITDLNLFASDVTDAALRTADVMDQNVLQNEPKEALFGGKSGITFYQKFAKQVREHLNPGGEFFLEFGFSEKQQLQELFAKELPDFTIEFKDDMASKPRMVFGKWNK